MSKIKVSAAIVTYNNRDVALRAVEKLLEYTKSVELTLYIIDNASHDGTLEQLEQHFGKRIISIENGDNLGFGHGHNTVLDLLESDYHFIINPDIIIDHDVLGEIVDYFESNPDIGLITPKILNLDGSDQHLAKRDPCFLGLVGHFLGAPFPLKSQTEHYLMLDEDLSDTIDIDFATGCFIAMRTELFCRIEGFDERFFIYYEDMDITRRTRKLARTVYYPHSYVYHAWERASSHSLKYFIILVLGMFKYFGKWGFKFAYRLKKPAEVPQQNNQE